MPSFSTTRRLARFLGMMEISTRCSEIASKANRSVTTTASGTSPRPGQRLVDPVADERALERPALNGRERDLSGEALTDEDPEPVAGAEVALALADAATGREAGSVLRRHRRTLGPGFPAQEPVGATRAHLVPRREVVLGQRSAGAPACLATPSGAWRTALAALIVPSTSPRAPSSARTFRRRAVWPMQPMRQTCPASWPAPAPISMP